MKPIEVEPMESEEGEEYCDHNTNTNNNISHNNNKRYYWMTTIRNYACIFMASVVLFFIVLKAMDGSVRDNNNGSGGGDSTIANEISEYANEENIEESSSLSNTITTTEMKPLDHFSQSYKDSYFFRQVLCKEHENESGSSTPFISLDFQCCDYYDVYKQQWVPIEPSSNRKNKKQLAIQQQNPRNITMAIYLNGQMGNMLSYIARAYGAKRSMEIKSFNTIQIHLVGIHKKENDENEKLVEKQLQTCFPTFFNTFTFDSGRWDVTGEFPERLNQLKDWYRYINISNEDPLNIDPLDCHHFFDPNCWHATYCQLQRMLYLQNQQIEQVEKGLSVYHYIVEPEDATISLPFLTSTNLPYIEAVDAYYNEIKNTIFLYNDQHPDCCDRTMDAPYDDEIVFHVRDFGTQMIDHGFHEMDAQHVANDIFNNTHEYKAGTRIALVSHSKEITIHYEIALAAKGYIVRHINHPDNGMHDFCFIKQTKREIIGMKMSTYVTWAALLSNAKRIRLYVIDSAITQKFHNVQHLLNHYTFQNKELKKRISYETYYTSER